MSSWFEFVERGTRGVPSDGAQSGNRHLDEQRLDDALRRDTRRLGVEAADDPVAQYFLAEMFLRGKGVDQDFEQAAAWYEKAAINGHADAQAAIGSLEMLGLGVPRHPTSGYFWLIISVVWEDSDLRRAAMSALGQAAEQLSTEQKRAVARAAVPEWKRSK